MEQKKLHIGLVNEFEGDQTLYFDLEEPKEVAELASYIKNNMELEGDDSTPIQHRFVLEMFTTAEMAEMTEVMHQEC